MAGQVKHHQIFRLNALPDLRMVRLLARLSTRNTDSLIGAVADELAREGITLVASTVFLEPLIAREGVLVAPRAVKRGAGRHRVRIASRARDCAPRPGADYRRQGPRGRRHRGDGRHGRRHTAGRRDYSRSRFRCDQSCEARPGHAVRRAGHRGPHDRSHEPQAGATAYHIITADKNVDVRSGASRLALAR